MANEPTTLRLSEETLLELRAAKIDMIAAERRDVTQDDVLLSALRLLRRALRMETTPCQK